RWAASTRRTSRPGWTQAAGSRAARDSSISGNGRVHVLGPGVDAAFHVVELAETELPEMLRRLRAAVAVVADEGQRRVLRKRLERARTVVERRVRHGNGGQRTFLRRTH